MKIAFIGYGQVGAPLADHLQRLGYEVTLAVTNPDSKSLKKALEKNSALKAAPLKDAVNDAEIIFLAIPFQANKTTLKSVSKELRGKILIDCTNPVNPDLTHGLNNSQSGSEMVQRLVPGTNVIKAFSIYGFESFEDSAYPDYNVRPVMMYCGQEEAAKKTVSSLLKELGWEPLDVGGLEQALHLEHMTLLWVRMVRVNGHSPDLVWAALKR